VAEGVPVGTDVVRLLATSRDIGVNAEISYAIVGGNEHRIFSIDPHSGLVSVAAGIDYERSRAFFLTVQARDGGEPPLTNRATVNITVLDVNDNAPVFGQMSYSATVSESSEVGVGILSLTATDLDQVNPAPSSPFLRGTFFGILDPDPLVRGTNPDPAIIKQKYCSKKNLFPTVPLFNFEK
jgi:hypothetical protein